MIEIKLPKEIKIGGLTFESRWDEETKRRLDEIRHTGQASYAAQEIRLHPDTSPEQFSLNFIHEVLHHIDSVYCNDSIVEKDISGLSNGLHQVLEQLGVRFTK